MLGWNSKRPARRPMPSPKRRSWSHGCAADAAPVTSTTLNEAATISRKFMLVAQCPFEEKSRDRVTNDSGLHTTYQACLGYQWPAEEADSQRAPDSPSPDWSDTRSDRCSARLRSLR